jgi:hypothetical protein
MFEIKAKIYYLISNGKSILITDECQRMEKPTTKEEDIEIYSILKEYLYDEIDFIELEYGTLASIFTNLLKSHSINLETKTLDCVYYTQEELAELNITSDNTNNIVDANILVSQVETLQDSVIDLKYENLLLKGE